MSEVRGQRRPARRGATIVLLASLAPQGTLLLLRTEPSLDLVVRSATVHLVVVSAISACALAVAIATAVAAGRSRDGSLVLLALGCLAVGFLMLGHGLTTPGIEGRPPNLWVARLPVLAIAGFAACLCAAAWPRRRPGCGPAAGRGCARRRRGGALVTLAARSDTLNLASTFATGSSFVEPGTVPAAPVKLSWSTFSAAAGEAGLSREYAGIHFRDADAHGLNLGRAIGTNTWNKAQTYFQGIAAG